MFVGVDGCRAGWFAVTIDTDGHWKAQVLEDAKHLWAECRKASLILIDIPIGLRDSSPEERLCDKEAREVLGPKRGSSVFPAPSRLALEATSYAAASRLNDKHTGRKLSKQSYAITGKIREVDALLDDDRVGKRLREVHPEVCFAALNRCSPMQHSKKTKEGFAERLDVLEAVFPQTHAVVAYALSNWLRKEVARDDVLDATAAAVTAFLGHGNLRTHPSQPERDSKGRPMEMAYYLLSALLP